MTHPLVLQLRFTRSEWLRGLEGITDEEARRRFQPMNCISWNIGHLAWQEQRYWLMFAQGRTLLPQINELFAYGAPACTPPLAETMASWREIIAAADPWLDGLTQADLLRPIERAWVKPGLYTNLGTFMQRMIYHYWYHQGENQAIRQMLGHSSLPDFVGAIDEEAPYLGCGDAS